MGNLNMEARQIHYRHDDTMTVDNKLLNLEGRVATLEDGEPAEVSKVDIAPVFSAESAYSAGDYVYHEGHLYKFTVDHAAGTWSDLDTEPAVVTADLTEQAGDIDQLKSGLTNVDVALDVPENSGKNVLPLNLDYLKSINAVGTWSGNVYSRNGLDFTVQTDSKNNVTGIAVSGTATANAFFELYVNNSGISQFVGCVLNGVQSGDGVGGTYGLGFTGVGAVQYDGDDYTIPSDYSSKTEIYIRVSNGVQLDTVIYPMIRPATITDPTFAPYIPSVESRIEAVENGEYKVIASVAADGVKTYAELFIGLYNFVDGNKCYLAVGNIYYNFVQKSAYHAFFSTSAYFNGVTSLYNVDIQANAANYVQTDIASNGTVTVTDKSSDVPTNGTVIKLVR